MMVEFQMQPNPLADKNGQGWFTILVISPQRYRYAATRSTERNVMKSRASLALVLATSGLLAFAVTNVSADAKAGAKLGPAVAQKVVAGEQSALPAAPMPSMPAKAGAPTAEMLADGKQTYTQYCAACHGPKGQGGPAPEGGKPARDLTQGTFQDGKTDAQLFAVVHDGIPPDFFMEAWGDRLSEAQIRNVVQYVRTLRSPPKAGVGAK